MTVTIHQNIFHQYLKLVSVEISSVKISRYMVLSHSYINTQVTIALGTLAGVKACVTYFTNAVKSQLYLAD